MYFVVYQILSEAKIAANNFIFGALLLGGWAVPKNFFCYCDCKVVELGTICVKFDTTICPGLLLSGPYIKKNLLNYTKKLAVCTENDNVWRNFKVIRLVGKY